MLLAINDRIKGWLGIAVVILITLPFALWGIGEYFSDAGPRYAAKVNGSEISLVEYERTVSLQRQKLLRENNGQMPISEKSLREQTLKQLINTRLLEDVSFNNGYRVSDNVLSERIRQIFTVDGVFDREQFESTVARMGMSMPLYEQTLRNELRVQQIQSAISATTFITDQQLNELALLLNQTRDFTTVTFNLEVFADADTPSDEQVKAYYEDNLSNFMTPERIKLDYVEITSDNLASEIQVDEADLQRMYDDYLDQVSSREERLASHILISTSGEEADTALQRIEEIQQKLQAGEDFASLAATYSEDPGSAQNGGDLGWVQVGIMVKPFESALFAMDKDTVSDIVETQFGYHLIKLNDVRSETPESFEIKRYTFEDDLKKDIVASEFYDLSERLANLAYENPSSLDVIVDGMSLELKSTDFFGRFRGEGIAQNEKVRNIAFSPLVMEEGSNSDIIEISPDHVVVVRMNQYEPSKPMPLEQVSSRIRNIIKVEQGHGQTVKAALTAKDRLLNGEPVSALQAEGVSIKSYTDIARSDRQQVSDPVIIQQAFTLGQDGAGSDGSGSDGSVPDIAKVDLSSGDVALIILDKVTIPSQIEQAELDKVRSQWLRDEVVRAFSTVMLDIKNNADIEKNRRLNEDRDE